MNDWRMYTDAEGAERTHVAWHEVLRAIAQLNGTTHTMVHAAYGDHVDLVVSGGNGGKVLVQWKEYDGEASHYILSEKERSGLMTTLSVEGEDMPVPVEWALSLEVVVPVCGDLVRTCERAENEQLQWMLIE